MKRDDEKSTLKTADNNLHDKKEEITSAFIENAHASGDGSVQKTDEMLPIEEDNKTSTDTNPY